MTSISCQTVRGVEVYCLHFVNAIPLLLPSVGEGYSLHKYFDYSYYNDNYCYLYLLRNEIIA